MGERRLRSVGVILGLQVVVMGCGSNDRPPYIGESTPAAPDDADGSDSNDDPKPKPKPKPSIPVGEGGCTAALPTGFCFASQKNDFIGGGKRVAIDDVEGQILVNKGPILSVSAEGAGQAYWSIELAAATGQYFLPGAYDHAERYPFNDYGAPGLDVSGDGRGCNELTGSFVVSEMERDPFGNFTRFAATFVQHCEGLDPALFGAINYNANGSPDAAPEDPADCEVGTPRGFCFSSQMGHADGNGRFVSVSDKDSNFRLASRYDGSISVTMLETMNVIFRGPGGAPLAPGAYEDAVDSSPSAPILEPGCEGAKGRFEILALDYVEGTVEDVPDESAQIEHFDVDYEYTCGGQKPAFHAKLRYTAP